MSATYHVIVQGTQEGISADEAVERLASYFRISADRLRSIFRTPGYVISPSRGIDLRTASLYRDALELRGCRCVLQPVHAPAVERRGVVGQRSIDAGRAHWDSSAVQVDAGSWERRISFAMGVGSVAIALMSTLVIWLGTV